MARHAGPTGAPDDHLRKAGYDSSLGNARTWTWGRSPDRRLQLFVGDRTAGVKARTCGYRLCGLRRWGGRCARVGPGDALLRLKNNEANDLCWGCGVWPLTSSSKDNVTLTESATVGRQRTRVLCCPSALWEMVSHVRSTWVVIIEGQVGREAKRIICYQNPDFL